MHKQRRIRKLPTQTTNAMRRINAIVFCLFCVLTVQAQKSFDVFLDKEGKIFILPKKESYVIEVPKLSYDTYFLNTPSFGPADLNNLDKDYVPVRIQNRPMDMQVLSEAYSPFFNIYTPMLQRVSPMFFDFNEVSVTRLSENWLTAVSGWQYTWPGAGGLTMVNPAMIWQSGQWTVSGGAFAGRFYTPFNASPEFTGGFNAKVRYDVNDRVAFLGWGQYAAYSEDEANNPHLLLNPFFNHSSIGGGMEYKVNDSFGFGFGLDYRHNPRTGKFTPQYMVYPVFKSKSGIQIRVY